MNWFTIYWLNGSVSYIYGETIEAAFTSAGYGHGAVSAIDWYDNGITETHWRDNVNREWVKYGEVELSAKDFSDITVDDLLELTAKNNVITVKFENNDILTFTHEWGHYYMPDKSCWIKYLRIAFGEYGKGSYNGESSDDEDQHHYQMTNGQHYSPDSIIAALSDFKGRFQRNPYLTYPTKHSESLESIHSKQKNSFNT